jgi:hypothetical protein
MAYIHIFLYLLFDVFDNRLIEEVQKEYKLEIINCKLFYNIVKSVEKQFFRYEP